MKARSKALIQVRHIALASCISVALPVVPAAADEPPGTEAPTPDPAPPFVPPELGPPEANLEDMLQVQVEFSKALERCDEAAAKFWLERHKKYVEVFRTKLKIAAAAGKFSKVDPAQARHEFAAMRDDTRKMEAKLAAQRKCARDKAAAEASHAAIVAEMQVGLLWMRLWDDWDYGGYAIDRFDDEMKYCDYDEAGYWLDEFEDALRDYYETGQKLAAQGKLTPAEIEKYERRYQGGLADLADMEEEYENPPPCGRKASLGAILGGLLGRVQLPRTGIGFRRDGAYGSADEKFALISPKSLRIAGFITDIGLSSNLTASIGYSEGEGRGQVEIDQNNGVDSGIVYGGLSPSGSSGIATPFGLSGNIREDYSAFEIGGRYTIASSHGTELPDDFDPTDFALALHGKYSAYRVKHSGSATYTGTSGYYSYSFSQNRDQSLKDDLFEVGLSGRAQFAPMGLVRPFINIGAGVYHVHSSLGSVEVNMSNFGPSQDQNFTLNFNESSNGFGFHGSGEAGIEFSVGPKASIVIGAAGNYRSKVGAIWNPYSGDQVYYDGLTTHLDKDKAWEWRGFAGVKMHY